MKLICSLFITFLKIGAFTFGGGYAMIALLENEFVEKKKWLGKSEFLDMVAVAESTPGPVAINSATYFIMKRLDDFLANNHHLIDEEIAENSLFIAFDNPMILDPLIPLFEKFSKGKPNCQLHFLFGNTEDIYDKLNKNRIGFGFIVNNASANDDTYRCLIISTKQNSIICEKAGCTMEPLDPSVIQTAVIWKKASSNALVNSFSDLLLSNRAAINAEYGK